MSIDGSNQCGQIVATCVAVVRIVCVLGASSVAQLQLLLLLVLLLLLCLEFMLLLQLCQQLLLLLLIGHVAVAARRLLLLTTLQLVAAQRHVQLELPNPVGNLPNNSTPLTC